MCLDVCTGDVLSVPICSSIDTQLYVSEKRSLVIIEFASCELWCCICLMYSVNIFENSMATSSV